MKKVLVAGAAGCIGINVIKYLLSEGKYEITVVDLPNSNSVKKLKKYRRRINVLYDDLTDSAVVDSLISDVDYVILLAGVLPEFINMKKSLGKTMDYRIVENMIKAINLYNPSCHLFYASTCTIYGNESGEITKTSKECPLENDFFAQIKFKCEGLIKKSLKNYTIYRLPIILTNPSSESFIYNAINSEYGEFITDMDAAYAFVKSIDNVDSLNKKVFNLTGGENCRIRYYDLITKIFKYYGVTWKYYLSKFFVPRDYHNYIFKPDKLNEILNYQNDSIDSYLMRLKRLGKKRVVGLFFGKIIVKLRNLKK